MAYQQCDTIPTINLDIYNYNLDWATADVELLNQMFGSYCSNFGDDETPSWEVINNYCAPWSWSDYVQLNPSQRKKIFMLTGEAQW